MQKPGQGVQSIDQALTNELIKNAHESPRRRINYNFHSSADDNPHRFLNVFLCGSYVRPHRHLNPPKSESFLVLVGWMILFVFDDTGAVRELYLVGNDPILPSPRFSKVPTNRDPKLGIDLAPGIWHTVAAITPFAVCYEVKPGPWDPATDKEFARWAPEEGSPEAEIYLERLLS